MPFQTDTFSCWLNTLSRRPDDESAEELRNGAVSAIHPGRSLDLGFSPQPMMARRAVVTRCDHAAFNTPKRAVDGARVDTYTSNKDNATI